MVAAQLPSHSENLVHRTPLCYMDACACQTFETTKAIVGQLRIRGAPTRMQRRRGPSPSFCSAGEAPMGPLSAHGLIEPSRQEVGETCAERKWVGFGLLGKGNSKAVAALQPHMPMPGRTAPAVSALAKPAGRGEVDGVGDKSGTLSPRLPELTEVKHGCMQSFAGRPRQTLKGGGLPPT